MADLENDATNPCFGCGPANPAGMHMRFAREGDAVRSSFVAEERFQGFPGTLHTAFLYLALVETANWTVWGLLGRAGVPKETGALQALARVPTGVAVATLGRRIGETKVRAEAMVDGRVVASIERTYTLPDRAEAERLLPHAMKHPAMDGLFP